MRWQAARGYPKSGYLNKLQHKALLNEIVAPTQTSSKEDSEQLVPSSPWRAVVTIGGPADPAASSAAGAAVPLIAYASAGRAFSFEMPRASAAPRHASWASR